jgi:hypothetical protein
MPISCDGSTKYCSCYVEPDDGEPIAIHSDPSCNGILTNTMMWKIKKLSAAKKENDDVVHPPG